MIKTLRASVFAYILIMPFTPWVSFGLFDFSAMNFATNTHHFIQSSKGYFTLLTPYTVLLLFFLFPILALHGMKQTYSGRSSIKPAMAIFFLTLGFFIAFSFIYKLHAFMKMVHFNYFLSLFVCGFSLALESILEIKKNLDPKSSK